MGERHGPAFVERKRRNGDVHHGTAAGATWHGRQGEDPCDACRAAKAEYDQRQRATPETTRRSRLHARAQAQALRVLKDAHPDEYRQLYLAFKENLLREVSESTTT